MGKVFVGGLSRDTTTTGLRVYFEQFGHISDCVVMKDRSTGAPRGFGFVTYRNQAIADHVVSQRHLIDGKEVEAKPAVPRDSETLLRSGGPGQSGSGGLLPPAPAMSATTAPTSGELKIFVGGLSHETSEAEFVSHFETFGKVTDCVIMCDPHTRKPRGFGFITYDNTASVDRVCANKFHDLNGKRVEVKRAIPQDRMLASASTEESASSEPAAPRFPFPGRGLGGLGNSPFAGGLPSHPWGKPQFENALSSVSSDKAPCGMAAALSAANSVLGPGSSDGAHQAFNYLGGNFSLATRSLSQGIRMTYGTGAESRDGMPDDAASFPSDARFTTQQGPQQQLLHQLQEEQLKLQIAQQAFNVQQVKQLQEMQQLVAAQHALVAQHSRSLDTNSLASSSMQPSSMSQHGVIGSFPLGNEALDAQLAKMSCSNGASGTNRIGPHF